MPSSHFTRLLGMSRIQPSLLLWLLASLAVVASYPAAAGSSRPEAARPEAARPEAARPEAARARVSSITDDPHFASPDGVPFDFHGELGKAYCLVTDTRLHINARLHGYTDPGTPLPQRNTLNLPRAGEGLPLSLSPPRTPTPVNRTWMKELGIMWLDPRGVPHRLHAVARTNRRGDRMHGFLSSLSLDGREVRDPYDGRRIEKGPMLWQYQGALKLPGEERETFLLSIKDLLGVAITMRPAQRELRTRTDAHVHFNIKIFELNVTENVHGILGQTYRTTFYQRQKMLWFKIWVQKHSGMPVPVDDESGRGFLDGSIRDYEPSGVTSPDCAMSVF